MGSLPPLLRPRSRTSFELTTAYRLVRAQVTKSGAENRPENRKENRFHDIFPAFGASDLANWLMIPSGVQLTFCNFLEVILGF